MPDGLVPIVFQKCCWSTFIFTTSQPSLRFIKVGFKKRKYEVGDGKWDHRALTRWRLEKGNWNSCIHWWIWPIDVTPHPPFWSGDKPGFHVWHCNSFCETVSQNRCRCCGECQMLHQVHHFGRKKCVSCYFACIVLSSQITAQATVLADRYCFQQGVSVRRCRLFIAIALAVWGGCEKKENSAH